MAKKSSVTGPIRAAGAVVLRSAPSEPEVALVYRERYDDWTLPKGKLKAGELACEAAAREVAEETGLAIRLGVPLDRAHYRVRLKGGGKADKVVDYWVATVTDQTLRPPDGEISAVVWLGVSEASDRLTYRHDRAVLEQAVAQPPTLPFVVLRHAKAVKRSDWKPGDEHTRPLTPYGKRQAARLRGLLAAYGIDDVRSSPWLRCLRTVVPYADVDGADITVEPDLTEHAAKQHPVRHRRTWQRLRDEAVRDQVPTVVCGHRPALPTALEVLGIAPRKVRTAEALVVHLDADGCTVAQEWHRPD